MATREDDALAGTLTPDGSPAPAGNQATLDPLAVTLAGGGAPSVHLPSGTPIGRYRVTGVLGHGGMGVVYAAHDPDLARPIAIKLLRPELRTSRARLLREGQAVARLTHANVVTVHDVGTHAHDLFIAMELVAGRTLGAWLRERRRPWREVLARLTAAGRGLAAAHAAGLVHRDFKPENVLLGDDGRVVVTDFGLAQLDDEPREASASASLPQLREPLDLTRTGALMGTPAYMSPEQFRGGRADARSDQFSFCVTLYEALVGVRPFDPRDGSVPSMTDLASAVERGDAQPMPRGGDVPRWLRRAVARGLQREPADRFASMDTLLAAITPPRRGRWIVGAAVAAAAAIALVVIVRDRAPARVIAPPACARADAIDAVWTDEARARHQALLGDKPWAAEELGWLDDFARRWGDAQRTACAAAATDARTQTCLDDALASLRTELARDSDQWPMLPAIEDCARPPIAVVSFPHSVNLGPQGVAQMSPDGRQLACSSFGEDAYVIPADPGGFRPTPVPGARVIGDWLPDGRQLIQRADGSQVLRAADGTETPLPGRGDLLFTQINVIAPDASRLAVQEADAVVVLAVADGARLAVVPGVAHEVAWEPDGRRLAVVSRNLTTLKLLDTTTGVIAMIDLRIHARALGEVGIAWLGPGRLVLDGGADATGTLGVWTLELDAASRLTRAPALRWMPSAGHLVRVFDAAAGRVLIESSLSRQRIFRHRAGKSEELPATLGNLRLSALDVNAGVAVAFSPDQVVRFEISGRDRVVLPARHTVLPTFREGRIQQAVSRGRDRWAIVELGDDGQPRDVLAFSWPEGHGAPFLRCSALDTSRCLIGARAEETLRMALLEGGALGRVSTLDGVSWNPDLSRDGRALVPMLDGRLLEVVLSTGATTTIGSVDADCRPRTVRWMPDGRRAWAVELCPDRFAVGAVGGAPFREVVTSDGWISGLEVLADGDFLYSEMDWDPLVQILDGL